MTHRDLRPRIVLDRPLLVVLCGLALAALGVALPRQDGASPAAFAPPAGFATGDSNGDMIAVTGLDITGVSILYVIDTRTRVLSVYNAIGGTRPEVRWVGARKIELDLQVDGFNDQSEKKYKALRTEFEENGLLPEGK